MSDPTSLSEAEAERGAIVAELVEIQNWLTGRDVQAAGRRVSSVTYHTEREKKCLRLTQLQARSGYLRDWIKAYNRENNIAGEHGKLLVELYHAVCELQDHGIAVGARVEAALDAVEMALPPKVLA